MAKPGRKKLFHSNVNLAISRSMLEALDAVLDGEERLAVIRAAIDKEIKRRERRKQRQIKPTSSTEEVGAS